MPNSFAHLHVHTAYSLLDGASQIKPLMEAVQKKGMSSIAISDHGVMYGVVDFYLAAKKQGIKPIIGCEVYEAPASRFDRKGDGPKAAANHLALLASDNEGYANLVKLVSAAHLEGFYYKPRIDKEILARHSKGLIAMSACLKGRVAEATVNAGVEAGLKVAGEYAEIFGKDNFFLELQDHDIPEQKTANIGLVEIGRRLGLPLVATNDVHYIEKSHAKAHEVLLCIQTNTTMTDPGRMRYATPEFYLKTAAEMKVRFGEIPLALSNTLEIAQRCNVEFDFKQLHYPLFQPPEGETQKSYLMRLCKEGLKSRYDIQDPGHPRDDREKKVMDRLNYEVSIIDKTGFIGYFLVVWDFVRFARESRIPVGPGRGSGAGSLVAYSLGITGIDPLRYELVFERFLNPDRISPPDFDIDFCQFRRGEVIDYVREKYGRDSVAHIITFGSLGAKTVIRDVGRALEVPLSECDRLAKMVPEGPDVELASAMKDNPEFKKMVDTDPNARRIMEHARVLEGLYRNAGVHAAGIVIGASPLVGFLPLAREKSGETVTQYSKDYVEKLGLLKADFLGLKTLTVIDETVKLVKRTRSQEVDVEHLPIDDPLTYELLRRGDTVGVFQLESKGMREWIRRIGLDRIEDLIAMIALYRPGPMDMIPDYVKRKCGEVKIEYMHELLEPVLKETYGILIYQEQVQQAAHVLAGYTMGQGDILRRAMGKKNPEEMEKQRAKFVEGCKKTCKMSADKAENIFDKIAKFANYGFNKSHSAGYGIVAFQTAYLKAHFPEEFMAALISSEIGNSDKLPVFMNEAIQMGIEILPPDVSDSEVRFKPLVKAIRYGLAGIKNVGEGAAESIVNNAQAQGPFKNLYDFCARLGSKLVGRKVLETLVRCGAFDAFGQHRARLFSGIDKALRRAETQLRDRQTGQGNLFDLLGGDGGGAQDEGLPDCDPWHENELLGAEKELLGIYMSGHPLTQHEALLRRYRLASVPELADLDEGAITRIGGLIARFEKRFTKNKDPMATLVIEDLEGTVEAVAYPEAFREYGDKLAEGSGVMVCGEVKKNEDGSAKLVVLEVYPLDQVPRLFTERVGIHIPAANASEATLSKVRDLLKAYPGHTPVVICLQFSKGEEVFLSTDPAYRISPDDKLVKALEHVIGENAVYVSVVTRPCRKSNGERRFNGFRRKNGPGG